MMPEDAIRPVPRRWPRRLALVGLLIAVLVGVLWWLAPGFAVMLVRDRLPVVTAFPYGWISVEALDAGGAATISPEVQVLLPPGRARAMAVQGSGWWLPPWVLRSGQRATGRLSMPLLRPTPFACELLLGGPEPTPLVCLRLGSGDLNHFLDQRGRTFLEVSDKRLGEIRYQVDAGRVDDDGPPLVQPSGVVVRRFRASASGAIDLWAVGDIHRHLVVRRMDGIATATITPVAGAGEPVYANWRTQGRLLPGSLRSGTRVLVFDGVPSNRCCSGLFDCDRDLIHKALSRRELVE